MGGIGSGNAWRFGTKTTCEALHRVDIRYMRKRGTLRPGIQGTLSWQRGGEPDGWINFRTYDQSVELDFRTRPLGGEWEPVMQRVPLEKVAQQFGGFRHYFRCPRCDRRCMVLYCTGRFYCRKCHNLSYQSQNENAAGRAQSMATDIRRQLGGSGSTDEMFPQKPKGMHWRTYRKLKARCERLDGVVELELAGLMARLGRFI